MASAEFLSDILTNAATVPSTFNGAVNDSGKVRVRTSIIELTTAFDAADIAAICKVPASASIKRITWYGDNFSTGQGHVGLYTGPNSSSLTEADQDCYAQTFDFGTGANTTGVNLAFATKAIDNINKRVYEDAGDSLGEFSEYWLCLTCNNEDFAAGTIVFEVMYTTD